PGDAGRKSSSTFIFRSPATDSEETVLTIWLLAINLTRVMPTESVAVALTKTSVPTTTSSPDCGEEMVTSDLPSPEEAPSVGIGSSVGGVRDRLQALSTRSAQMRMKLFQFGIGSVSKRAKFLFAL